MTEICDDGGGIIRTPVADDEQLEIAVGLR